MQTLQNKAHQTTLVLLEALCRETDNVRKSMLQYQPAQELPRVVSLRDLDQSLPTLI
ncbi:MAG: hypothetical protein QNI90_18955 [Dinoroseobacter sp.]|nr:hypothetical protein [Dinoroseobacter sp.]